MALRRYHDGYGTCLGLADFCLYEFISCTIISAWPLNLYVIGTMYETRKGNCCVSKYIDAAVGADKALVSNFSLFKLPHVACLVRSVETGHLLAQPKKAVEIPRQR
jgi:hypothetical protein